MAQCIACRQQKQGMGDVRFLETTGQRLQRVFGYKWGGLEKGNFTCGAFFLCETCTLQLEMAEALFNNIFNNEQQANSFRPPPPQPKGRKRKIEPKARIEEGNNETENIEPPQKQLISIPIAEAETSLPQVDSENEQKLFVTSPEKPSSPEEKFVRVFKCRLCCSESRTERVFATQVLLKGHLKDQHDFSSCYLCDICDAPFPNVRSATRHRNNHCAGSGPKQVSSVVQVRCEFCGVNFPGKQNLRAHMLWKHDLYKAR